MPHAAPGPSSAAPVPPSFASQVELLAQRDSSPSWLWVPAGAFFAATLYSLLTQVHLPQLSPTFWPKFFKASSMAVLLLSSVALFFLSAHLLLRWYHYRHLFKSLVKTSESLEVETRRTFLRGWLPRLLDEGKVFGFWVPQRNIVVQALSAAALALAFTVATLGGLLAVYGFDARVTSHIYLMFLTYFIVSLLSVLGASFPANSPEMKVFREEPLDGYNNAYMPAPLVLPRHLRPTSDAFGLVLSVMFVSGSLYLALLTTSLR